MDNKIIATLQNINEKGVYFNKIKFTILSMWTFDNDITFNSNELEEKVSLYNIAQQAENNAIYQELQELEYFVGKLKKPAVYIL